MAKAHDPKHGVHPARGEAAAAAPPGAGDESPEDASLSLGWRIALFVWCFGFFGLVAYELWTGMLMGLFRR